MINCSEKYKDIALRYGLANQINRLVEECSELIQAVMKYKRITESKGLELEKLMLAKENIIEELADVCVIMEQIIYLFGCKREVEKTADLKIMRQIKRINDKTE